MLVIGSTVLQSLLLPEEVALVNTPYVFRCLTGISEEHRQLITKHKTLSKHVIATELTKQKTMTAAEALQVLDQIAHRAIKDALLEEERSKRPSVALPPGRANTKSG